jgi:hypothetical protein
MNDEKMKILEMLESGKISAQEAIGLMELVWENKDEARGNRQEKEREPNFIDEIKAAARDVVETVGEAIRDVEREADGWFGAGFGFRTVTVKETLVACLANREVKALVVGGGNAPVSVVCGAFGDGAGNVEFEINAGAKSGAKDKGFEITVENGVMRLSYDEKAFRYVGVKVTVPAGLNLEEITLTTKNAPITAKAVNAGLIGAVTKNAKITLADVGGGVNQRLIIDAVTKNAGITVKLADEGRGVYLKAATSNAKVAVGIKGMDYLTEKKNNVEAQTPDYPHSTSRADINLKTSNAKIQVK